MTSRPTAPRWAFWTLALALLLKAAVPLLATASAHAQGKTLVEVCTVYGVATVALDAADGTSDTPAPANPAHGEHCSLSSLLAYMPPPAPATPAPVPPPPLDATQAGRTASAPDASARWVAGLKHAPPARA